MAPVLSSLCILPSSNVAPIHSLRTIPHPLFLHHSRMRNLSILAASEASDSLHSSSAHHHHHQHQKPLKSSSPFSSIIPPLAASILVFSVCSPPPGEAGILSGSTGLTSFDFPSLPTPGILKKIQEENKARYEGLDEKFKSSSLVQELLRRSKQNAELHKQEIQNKYCQRGADWGVGDCSTAAMSEEERTSFMEALKGNKSAE